MKKIVTLIILLFLTQWGFTKKTIVLEEVLNPETIHCDNNQLYMTEKASIYIYSLKDYKLVKKFGERGEGPGEFKIDPLMGGLQIDIGSEYIIANTIGRVLFFTKKAELVKEIPIPEKFVLCKKFGSHFLTMNFSQGNEGSYIKINLYDHGFKNKQEIFKTKHFFQQGQKFNPLDRPPFFSVVGMKIVVDDGKMIYIYNEKGKELLCKDLTQGKIVLSDENEKDILDFFKKDPKYRSYWDYFKTLIEMPDYFPAIRHCIASNDKIYIRTYKKKADLSELQIYDMKGRLLKKTYLTILDKSLVEHYPYTIFNDKLYQVFWNEDDEVWELHITKIR